MTIYYCYHQTPIGQLLLAGDGDNLSLLGFPNGKMQRRHESTWVKDADPFKEVSLQLDGYFAGDRRQFDLALAPEGTEFQRRVWSALTEIAYGETWSYGELARHIGKPKASRAVGAANGQNPIPVLIPLHRMIGCSGHPPGLGGGAGPAGSHDTPGGIDGGRCQYRPVGRNPGHQG